MWSSSRARATGPWFGWRRIWGIDRSCLQKWVYRADADDVGGSAGRLTSAEKKELAGLRRRNKQLEMENEILKRAVAYFARENVLPK